LIYNLELTQPFLEISEITNAFDNVSHVWERETGRIYTIMKTGNEGVYKIILIEEDRQKNIQPEEVEKSVSLEELDKDFMPIEFISSEHLDLKDFQYIISHTAHKALDPSKTH